MAEGTRRIMAEFLDVGHVIRRADGQKVAVLKVRARPGRVVSVDLSDGTTRRFRATEIVEVTS